MDTDGNECSERDGRTFGQITYAVACHMKLRIQLHPSKSY